jgi:hypothetical protein
MAKRKSWLRTRHLEEPLKTTGTLLVAPLLCLFAGAQNTTAQPAQSAGREVYHVHFAKAALGKAAQLGDYLKTQTPNSPMPGHYLVLRHQDGDAWDYVVIEHLGAKATVDAAGSPPPPAARDLGDWHGDTFVSGPPWPEFARAMGIAGESAAKTASSVYVVSVYRAAPGHRAQLEKLLSQPPGSGDTSAGNALMPHLEGAPWQYLSLARYHSWQDFATNESNSKAQMLKGSGDWFQLRDHAAFHTDTLADRIAP